jgi:hypothetical protein
MVMYRVGYIVLLYVILCIAAFVLVLRSILRYLAIHLRLTIEIAHLGVSTSKQIQISSRSNHQNQSRDGIKHTNHSSHPNLGRIATAKKTTSQEGVREKEKNVSAREKPNQQKIKKSRD